MKKWTLLLLCVLMSGFVLAQSKPFFVKEKEYTNGFSQFGSRKAKKVAKHINQYLQLALFQNLLENLGDSLPAVGSTQIHINNKNILSISVQNAGDECRHLVFNAATGAVIDLPEMMNANGITFIRRKIIKTYQAEAANATFSDKCLKEDIHNFKLTSDTLIVFTEKCAAQDSLHKGELRPIAHGFSGQSMVKYLTNYGQAMFGLERKLKMKKMKSFAVPGLYAGKQDNQAVVLQLDAPFAKQLTGVLYYAQSKKAIPLSGSFKNNRFDVATEQGHLSLIISGGQIQGTVKSGNKIISNLILVKQ